jgi:Cu2+-exporting ATPase
MLKCNHCLLEVSESHAIFDRINSEEKVFCCYGCQGVALLIGEEGLEEFYRRRNNSWTPGPPEDKPVEAAAFTDTIRQVGDHLETEIILDGIRCASCIWLIEKILLRTEGVEFARVNYATHMAKVRWKPVHTEISGILARIKAAGYTPKPFTANIREEEIKRQQKDLLVRFGTAAFFSMQIMMYSVALYAGYFQGISTSTKVALQIVSLVLATPVLFYSGMPFMRGAVRSLRNMAFNMDVLIITGAGAAYVYSAYRIYAGGEIYLDTLAMIITLILLGRYIEVMAKGRASEVIVRLLSLNPKEARVVKQNPEFRNQNSEPRTKTTGEIPDIQYQMVAVSTIKEGDIIQIKPGERIPLDGILTEGTSEVDESMLTGESKPVLKTVGNEVFCGTQNLYGSFIFKVQRTGENTVLSQIIKTVEDAQARQAPVQAVADKFIGFFVPGVLILSAMTALAWFYYDGDLTEAVMNSISVLVIACPCALGLATPLAILIGTTKGTLMGILVKGGDIIEKARNINTVVLDKTGTITEGKPELTSYRGVGIPDMEALRLTASLEHLSEHSISKAIVNASEEAQHYSVAEFTACPGKGVKGVIEGKYALVGSRDFIESEGIFNNLDAVLTSELLSWTRSQENSGATVIYLSFDGRLSGIFVISDTIRKEASEAIAMLRDTGHDVIMITGDAADTATTVAQKVGLDKDKVMAQQSPVDKAKTIKAMQQEGKDVLMVGDGINDAPALIQADIGIAMGRATDIALESADMVLMRSDLRLVSGAITLSKRTYRVIKQNLFWAFIYNITALPLAVTGILHPIVAAIAMTLSSLSVVGNSMRLKRGRGLACLPQVWPQV